MSVFQEAIEYLKESLSNSYFVKNVEANVNGYNCAINDLIEFSERYEPINTTYFVVQLLQDIDLPQNEHKYYYGDRLMVWQDNNLGCYWTANDNDNFKQEFAKKVYQFEGFEV